MSFRFLNPRLVDEYPLHGSDSGSDSVCYLGINPDEPDVLCRDLAPNRLHFLGWWRLNPERHCMEWFGFVLTSIIVLVLLVPKVTTRISSHVSRYSIIPQTIHESGNSRSNNNNNADPSLLLLPRLWMKASTMILYPYVSYTKLSWNGSNYPGRWLLFVCMPVGTLWIGSALFCFASSGFHKRHDSSYSYRHALRWYRIRYWMLDTWLSCVPILGIDLLLDLGIEAARSLPKILDRWREGGGFGAVAAPAQNGDNAWCFYFCHALYVVLAPMVYVLGTGELTMHPPRSTTGGRCSTLLWNLAVECVLRQAVGTAIASLYYMGIVTPASIVAGLNVNALLDDGRGVSGSPSFRIRRVAGWLWYGWVIRFGLGLTEALCGSRNGRENTSNRQKNFHDSSDSKSQ